MGHPLESLKNIGQQLSALWKQASVQGRVAFIATAILCVALILGVGFWSSQPQYVPLASNLSPSDAAEIISKLDANNITNKLNYSGSTVLVDKSQFSRARLLVSDVVATIPDETSMGGSIWDDPRLTPHKLLEKRERRIAETLERMDAIETATVTIGRPEPSPFLQDQEPTTASVVLKLRPNAALSRTMAFAVVATVSNSVEGLDANNITVTDTRGRILWSGGFEADAEISNQLDYQRSVEADLASKAERLLLTMLGQSRATVQVTADIDFTSAIRETTTFDPEGKAKTKEEISTESSTNSLRIASGVAGTTSNQSPRPSPGPNDTGSIKSEKNTTEYENSRTIDKVKEYGGTIKRLTIAAVVDQSPISDGAEVDAAAAQGTQVTKEQIESIVKQAVGFDARRNDEIEVLLTKLNGAPIADADLLAPGFNWEVYIRLAKQVSLGIAALVSFALGLLMLRKLRPVVVSTAEESSGSRQEQAADRFLSQAKDNPDAVAKIISAWLGDSGSDSKGSSQDELKRAA